MNKKLLQLLVVSALAGTQIEASSNVYFSAFLYNNSGATIYVSKDGGKNQILTADKTLGEMNVKKIQLSTNPASGPASGACLVLSRENNSIRISEYNAQKTLQNTYSLTNYQSSAPNLAITSSTTPSGLQVGLLNGQG